MTTEMLVDDLITHETIPLATDVEHTNDDVEHKNDNVEHTNDDVEYTNYDHDLSISTVDIVQETIVELFKQSVSDINFEYKFQLTLDNEVVDVFNKILALSPNSFVEIHNSLSAIALNQKINSEDIPQLIVLVKSVYQTINAVKNSKVSAIKMTELVGGVIKLAFHVLVKEGKIKIEHDRHSVFLDQFDELVDSCVGLLSFTESLKPVGCFKKWCKM